MAINVKMKGITFRLLVFVLFFYITNYNVLYGQTCTSDICQKCCHPTTDGCENNFYKTIRGNYYTDRTYCQQCDCKNPERGCGWIAQKYEKVNCTSCTFLKHASIKINYFDTCGCGHKLKHGSLRINI